VTALLPNTIFVEVDGESEMNV